MRPLLNRRRLALAVIVLATYLWSIGSAAAAADPSSTGSARSAAGIPATDDTPREPFLSVTSSPTGSFDNLAPGDTVAWFVTASSTARFDADVTLRLTSASVSPLATDAEQGLQVTVTSCSSPWSNRGGKPACPGEPREIARGPLAVVLGGYALPPLPAGSTANYLAQVTLPQEATNVVAGQAAALGFEVVATQAGAGADADEPGPGSGDSGHDGGDHEPEAQTSANAPGEPTAPNAEPVSQSARSGLAFTGASVSPIALALVFLVAGVVILVTRPRRPSR